MNESGRSKTGRTSRYACKAVSTIAMPTNPARVNPTVWTMLR